MPCKRSCLAKKKNLTSQDYIQSTHPDIVVSINLLIGRVSSVITPSNRQQQDIEVENVGKVERDRDRTTFTGVVGHLAVNSFGGLVGGSIRVMLFFFQSDSISNYILLLFSKRCSRWGQPKNECNVSFHINSKVALLTIQGSPPWVR